eukprot:CAMPEP_0170411982 /NCGR_PEP_ID=MMETSP0117_2-20130122/30719_2 /TAXON_ID=400756 /ORGANISM="Durinskia baltica, Strain CSIRO CS-38" /LENGTH=56 /DNA_ID=CAMNT_0010669629 /DNA_START=1 /DNA_END=168 /DNA_ORIENTATION=-
MRSWLLMSSNLSRSMPRYEYFRKVRFLGWSSSAMASSGLERGRASDGGGALGRPHA